MDPNEAVEKIEKQAEKDVEFSRELSIKFFFHWALLSGAAITLFITFLSSDVIQNNITKCSKLYVQITFISLVISMLLSSIRNFLIMKDVLRLGAAKYKIANDIKWGVYNGKTPTPMLITEIIGYIAIIAFIVGIIAAYFFISGVIF
ncbi:MAG: hypothetical protein WCS86_02325 [Candidatus Paceibacterota bacterium]